MAQKKPVNYNPKVLPRSQDAVPLVLETTALYGIKKNALMKHRCRIGKKPYFFEVSDEEALDLDNEKDFEYLEYYVRKICLAQSIEELKKFILSKSESEKLSVVPLNLETQLYCIDNKINFINPINIIDTRTHMEILEKSDELIKSIKFGNIFSHSVREEYKSIIRFHFNACCFLIKLLKNINKENEISKVYISGWSSFYSPLDLRNYFISDLVKDLFKILK